MRKVKSKAIKEMMDMTGLRGVIGINEIMDILHEGWVECKNCIYFEECANKENKDGCYFGETDIEIEKEVM